MRLRVIDIETSGGNPSEIVEIAAVDVVESGDGWTAEPSRSTLFRPRDPIWFHAMAIRHLTPEHLEGEAWSPSITGLGKFIWRHGRPDALVAHDISFERQYITADATCDLPWICTLKAARNAWPEAPGHSNQVLRYWRGLNHDPALAIPPHRAAPDA
jgi:exodeoxyribonuclease X